MMKKITLLFLVLLMAACSGPADLPKKDSAEAGSEYRGRWNREYYSIGEQRFETPLILTLNYNDFQISSSCVTSGTLSENEELQVLTLEVQEDNCSSPVQSTILMKYELSEDKDHLSTEIIIDGTLIQEEYERLL